jgi:hypothetical protein
MCVIRTAPATISLPPYVRSCEREHAPGRALMPYERSCVREYGRLWPATHGRTPPQQARGVGGGARAACVFF